MDELLDDAIDPEDGEKYEALFRKQNPEGWQVQTFEKTKKMYVC